MLRNAALSVRINGVGIKLTEAKRQPLTAFGTKETVSFDQVLKMKIGWSSPNLFILEIDTMFSDYSNDEHSAFWTGIETDVRWQELREKAKSILVEMGKERLKIEISTTRTGKILSSIYTKITLVD